MTLDTITELDEETSAHTAEDEAEEAMLKYLAGLGLTKNEDGQIVAAEENKALKKVVICSCGCFTCGAIGIFGHPVPVFTEQIEPIPSQFSRDREALRLKGGSS
jgi:hypothetical protein